MWIPCQPQIVWDCNTQDWLANPLFNGSAFDISAVFDQSPLEIAFREEAGGTYSKLEINESGVEVGYLSPVAYVQSLLPMDTYEIYYRYTVDVSSATCVIQATFGDRARDGFTMILKFSGDSGGTYTMMGTFPCLTYTDQIGNHISVTTGTFLIGPLRD